MSVSPGSGERWASVPGVSAPAWLLVAQHAQQRPGFPDGLACRVLDAAHQLGGALRIPGLHHAGCRGLHPDRRNVVRHHVVQFAGDAQAFVDDGPAGQLPRLLAQLFGLRHQQLVLPGAAPRREAQEDGPAEVEEIDQEVVAGIGNHRVDEPGGVDRHRQLQLGTEQQAWRW